MIKSLGSKIGGFVFMLSNDVEMVIKEAIKIAQERRQEYASVEHLCLALFNTIRIGDLLSQIGVSKSDLNNKFLHFINTQIESVPPECFIDSSPSLAFQKVLERALVHVLGAGKKEVLLEHVLVSTFDEEESHAVYMMQQAGITRLDLVTVISHGMHAQEEFLPEPSESTESINERSLRPNALEQFATCLTEEARKNRLDTVIGRDKEILRALQVLSRRRKNNPLFVGEAGVGKTALAFGLAQRIVEEKVPAHLKTCEMYLLDMGSLLAGTRYRGDFESRLKSVLKLLQEKDNTILVIDEIHTVVGAGSTMGSSMDAANMLKPLLSSGNIRCIGSTTHKEYRAYFEKDRALARRFQKIDIDEPSLDDCQKILFGLKKQYEEFHGILIADEAIETTVLLSQKYLHERKLPDKAFDLLDEACSQARINGVKKTIDVCAIEEAVALMANVPSQSINQDDKDLLKNLHNNLKDRIFGQHEAITTISNAILMARAGLKSLEKPIGSFLFSGPSGVGKTECARVLAKTLGVNLIRFDMSEYMERHTASRLVGAPPGYVGFDQGGLLTDAIHKSPYAVLLLDEIEKAHPDVFNILLQIMDYGKLTDSNGRHSDFRHVILIMTSNLGAKEAEEHSIGFTAAEKPLKNDKAVKRLFSVEFRNRLDAHVIFERLSKETMLHVVDKFIDELKSQLSCKNIKLFISNEAQNYLAEKGYDESMGARPLSRIIDEEIKKPLSQEMVFGALATGGEVNIKLAANKLHLLFKND
jgi:ATP-dependent Clp protease ATP-binding subunit ClpA